MSKRRRARVPVARREPAATVAEPLEFEYVLVSPCRHIYRVRLSETRPEPPPTWCDRCRRVVDLKVQARIRK